MLRAFALALTLSLLLGACGSDEDGGTDQAAEQSPNESGNEEFCDSFVDAQAAVIAASSGGDAGDVNGLLDDVEASAPEEVSDTVETFVPEVRRAMEEEDQSVFESDEFQDADEELDRYIAENCGYKSAEVEAVDYEFEGIPSTIPVGNYTVDWTNAGKEVHELVLVRFLEEDVSVDDLLEMSDKEAQNKLEFVAGFFGEPGTEDVETLPLEAGRYAAVCFIPVGATDMEALEKAKGAPHIMEGMSAEFTVE